MHSLVLPSKQLVVLLLLALLSQSAKQNARAAEPAEQQFKDAYFLETHEHDPAAAAAIYEKVAQNTEAPAALREEAKARLAACREDQAAADFAQLMPPDAFFYVEVNRPGEHIGRLINLLGLSTESQAALASPSDGAVLPGGLVLPSRVGISPAFVRELRKIRGFAVAITGVDREGIPSGVAAIHPGDVDLVRGLIETGVQILPQADEIAGFNVYRIEDKVWLALTQRLVLVADAREKLADAIGRVKNPQGASLAKEDAFSRLKSDREGALIFAYVDGRKAMQAAAPHLRGQEAMMARTFLDLDHLQSVSATVATTADDVRAQVRIVLDEGHRNLAYAMVRTAPLSKKSLAHVPSGAAALAVLGLNPVTEQGGQASGASAGGLSAMDIGREVFSNVEEVSLFVLPPASAAQPMSPAIPEIGMVAAVKDPSKSEALWDQLLSLASLFGPRVAAPPKEIEIAGQKGKEYQFAGAPPVVVVRLADRAIAAGTRGAVAAAVASSTTKSSIADDPQFKPLLESLRPETSKAVMVHVGRVLSIAAAVEPREFRGAQPMVDLIGDLRFMVATHEKPSEFAAVATAAGLPNVRNLIQTYIGLRSQHHRTAVRAQSPQPPRPVSPDLKRP